MRLMGLRAGSLHRAKHRGALAAIVVAASLISACGGNATAETTHARSSVARAPSTTGAATTMPSSTTGPRHRAQGGGRLGAPAVPGTRRLQIRHVPLTTQNWVTYDFSTTASTVTASAPAGLVDPNIREVFWRDDAVPERNAQSCISWAETSSSVKGEPIQPGLAMRIASVGPRNEGIKAITLTENIVYAGVWMFNVHVWDTRLPVPMTLVRTFDVSHVVGRITNVDGRAQNLMVKPPWHLCAQARGNEFRFKVWTQDNPEPSWNDPQKVFTTPLPPGWDHAGYSGGYIGHLHANQSATATGELATPLD